MTVPGGDEPSAAPDTVLVRLEENIGAAAIELTSDDLREIDNAASLGDGAWSSVPRSVAADDRPLNGRRE